MDIRGTTALKISTPEVKLRRADLTDISTITTIYNQTVRQSEGTLDIALKNLDQMVSWFHRHGPDYPILVASYKGVIHGWASLSPFADKCGYTPTVESSIYVAPNARGLGIGKKLKLETIRVSQELGYHSIISRVVASNQACNTMNTSMGFELVGQFKEIGFKFGQYHDMNFYQYICNPKNR